MANTRFVKATSKQEACEIAGRDWFKIKKVGDGYMFFDNKEAFAAWSAGQSFVTANKANTVLRNGKPMMIVDFGSFTFDCHIMMDTTNKERKFKNPWSDSEAFTDLGSCTFDGTYYETYCFTREGALCIGARFGEDGDYISAGSVNMKNGEIDFYGHEAKAIKEAIKQILTKGFIDPQRVVKKTLLEITFSE